MAQYIGNLGGNIFLNIAVSAAMQVPSTLFACWSTKALGRRWTLVLADLLGGTGMLLISEYILFLNVSARYNTLRCGMKEYKDFSLSF